MNIEINGKSMATEARTIARLAEELGIPSGGTAIAVNGKMVPRTEWDGKALKEGDKILIIRAACGG